VQFWGVLTRYSTYCFLVIMTVKCYFLSSSVSPVLVNTLAKAIS
jgi:hypothetical protein